MILWFRRCEKLVMDLVGAFPAPDHRVTLLAQALVSRTAVEPWLRWDDESRQVVVLPPGKKVFEPGWPVAGRALECPLKLFGLRLPEFEDAGEVRQFFEGRGLDGGTAKALAGGESMRRTREIVCVALPTNEPLVVSIDSFKASNLIRDVQAPGRVRVCADSLPLILDKFMKGLIA